MRFSWGWEGAEGSLEGSLNRDTVCDIDGGNIGDVGHDGDLLPLPLPWHNLCVHFPIQQVWPFLPPILPFLPYEKHWQHYIGQVWRLQPTGVEDEPRHHIPDAHVQSSSLRWGTNIITLTINKIPGVKMFQNKDKTDAYSKLLSQMRCKYCIWKCIFSKSIFAKYIFPKYICQKCTLKAPVSDEVWILSPPK